MSDNAFQDLSRQIEDAPSWGLVALWNQLESRRAQRWPEAQRLAARLKLATKALSHGEVDLCLLATRRQTPLEGLADPAARKAELNLRKLRARALVQAGMLDESRELLDALLRETEKA